MYLLLPVTISMIFFFHCIGCCLNSPYGCCPDNINPARGPESEGCSCEYSPYGNYSTF